MDWHRGMKKSLRWLVLPAFLVAVQEMKIVVGQMLRLGSGLNGLSVELVLLKEAKTDRSY